MTLGSREDTGEKCVGTVLLPGVRVSRVDGALACALDVPAGTLFALCCARGSLEVAAAGKGTAAPTRVSCGEVLSLVSDGGEKCVRPQGGQSLLAVALLVTPDEVTPAAAAALEGFDVDVAELARMTAAATAGASLVDAAGSGASHAFMDLSMAAGSANVAALKLRAVECLRCLCEARAADAAAPRASKLVGASPRTSRSRIARAARDLMRANVEHPLTISELAAHCQTSPTVLKESFRAEFGMPVHEWYRRFRMTCAADLLSSGTMSISEVARAVGYSNASKFAQAFAACMGAAPSAWRRNAIAARPA